MKKLYAFAAAALLSLSISAQDTFSIIAVDPATGEIGSAGASCVPGIGAGGIIDIITDIIPGRGGVNSQAWVCIPNVNLQNAITRMEAGDSPSEIITWLLANDACSAQNFNPEFRQYGIVDLDGSNNPRTAGWTGSMADDYKEDRQGANYSVQGNILLNQTVIDNMEDNFNNTTGTLADKLMAAMQGANFAGADARCLSAGTSSTTAYLTVYRADDNPGEPYLRLNVGDQPSGTEPIDILQDLYDDFLSVADQELKNKIDIFPNPVREQLQINLDDSLVVERLEIFNINGQKIQEKNLTEGHNTRQSLDVNSLTAGVYFLTVSIQSGTTSLKFVKQ